MDLSTLIWLLVGVLFVYFIRWMLVARAYHKYTRKDLVFEVVNGWIVPKTNCVLVTGGNGFLGKYVVDALVKKNRNVIVFDVVMPREEDRYPNVCYVQGNLLNKTHVLNSLMLNGNQRVDSVIHMASIIPMLGVPDKAVWEINLLGTQNIVDECVKVGVPSFLYTSSATICLDKNVIISVNITEDMPMPIEHLDVYTTTKAAAEKYVLDANTGTFKTCSIRPAAIFGIGDKMLADCHVRGVDRFIIGDGIHKIDWVCVQNVAHAHILAEEALSKSNKLSGNSYFIGNNEQKEYRWFNGLGTSGKEKGLSHWQHPHPLCLPISLLKFLSFINSTFCLFTGMPLMSPGLSHVSIQYTQRTYLFNTDKANRDFNYVPLLSVEEGVKQAVEFYQSNILSKSKAI